MVLPKSKRRKTQVCDDYDPPSPPLDGDDLRFCDGLFEDSDSLSFMDLYSEVAPRARKTAKTKRSVSSRHPQKVSLIDAANKEENVLASYLSGSGIGKNDCDNDNLVNCPMSDDCVSSCATELQKNEIDSQSQTVDRLCMSKNAIAARENRQKKKDYIQTLEATHKTTTYENQQLKKNLEVAETEVKKLKKEVSYLKGVLANHSALSSLLKNIVNTPGLQFSSSFKVQNSNTSNVTNEKNCNISEAVGEKVEKVDHRMGLSDITCSFESEKVKNLTDLSHSKKPIKVIKLKSKKTVCSIDKTVQSNLETLDDRKGIIIKAETVLKPYQGRKRKLNDSPQKDVQPHENGSGDSINQTESTMHRVKATPKNITPSIELASSTKNQISKKRGERRRKLKKPLHRSARA